MGENSKIEWTDHTFNPWRGCTKVAPGCAHCYAEKQAKRNPGTLGIWGADGTRVLASPAMWKEPIKWNRDAEAAGVRRRVFCASMADVFEDWPGQMTDHHGAPLIDRFNEQPYQLDHARRDLFRLIDMTPNLDWLLLTKRPENIRRMAYGLWTEKVPGHVSQNEGDGRFWKRRQNVWLGTSIAVQGDADKNIPELLKCRDLSPVLFLSMEPLLGPVDLCGSFAMWHYECLKCMASGESIDKPLNPCGAEAAEGFEDEFECDGSLVVTRGIGIDWVIVGGESGPQARPMHPAWVRSIRDQCQAAGVPFFFKQWGEWAPIVEHHVMVASGNYGITPTGEKIAADDKRPLHTWHFSEVDDDVCFSAVKVGKHAAGRLLDGCEWNEMPQVEAHDH